VTETNGSETSRLPAATSVFGAPGRAGHLSLYLLYLALLAVYWLTQPPLTYQAGFGWDGVSYGAMAWQIEAGEPVVAEKPFCHRLGTPWLAGKLACLLPDSLALTQVFMLVNLLPILLYPFLFLRFWRRFGMSDGFAWLFVFVFLLSWHVSPRFNFYYPVTPDPWLWLFALLLLPELGRSRLSVFWYTLLIFIGVLFRELVLWVALAGVLGRALSISPGQWRSDLELRRQLIALGVGIVAMAITHQLATGTGGYTLARAVIGGFWHKPFPVWINGLFGAFGVLLVLPLSDWRWLRDWIARHPQLAVWLAGLWVLGWCAGTDTIRIVFWSAPVAFLLLHDHYRAHPGFYRRWWVVGLLLAVHFLSQRWATPTPDYDPAVLARFPVFTPQGACPYLDLEPQYAPHWVSKLSVIQYALVSLVLTWRFQLWRHREEDAA